MVQDEESASIARRLLDAVRGIGIERGADLILTMLHMQWGVVASGLHGDIWRSVLAEGPDFERLGPLRLDPDVSELIQSAMLRDTLDEVMAIVGRLDDPRRIEDIFEAVLESLEEATPGEDRTPRAVARLLARLTVRPGSRVHDFSCGTGDLLVAALDTAPDVAVSGHEINPRVAHRATMRLRMRGLNEPITIAEPVKDAPVGVFDVVLGRPPWDGSHGGDRRSPAPPRSGDLIWLLLALQTLRPAGRAAVVLPLSSLSPSLHTIHQHLLAERALEAVIALPGGLFRHSSIPTAIWLLRKAVPQQSDPSVLFVDAESLIDDTGARRLELSPDAFDRLALLVGQFQTTGVVDAPAHLASVVPISAIDLDRGLFPEAWLADPPVAAHPAPERTLLTEVSLHNFKAFGPGTRIGLAPLTLVYGANSAGKSSIIQSLLLLKQSLQERHLVTQGQFVNVGGFPSVVHQHAGTAVGLGFSYGLPVSWLPAGGTVDPALTRTVQWVFGSEKTSPGGLRHAAFSFGPHQLELRDADETLDVDLGRLDEVFQALSAGTLLYPFTRDRRPNPKYQDVNARRALRVLRRDGTDTLPLRRVGLLPTADPILTEPRNGARLQDQSFAVSYAGRIGRLAAGISAEVRQLLDNLVWLGPLRSPPRRVYDRSSTDPNPGDGKHTAMYLFDHISVVDQVNEWLARLEVPYSLEVVPVNSGSTAGLVGDLVAIVLTDRRSGVKVTPADVGFGISQVLPIVVELLARRESIIMIEQPETHLHPRLQSRVADLLIETTRAGGRGNQVIVETHSEHLMLRIQRRIREGVLDPGDVAVVYIDQDQEGRAVVTRLRLDAEGSFLDEWPHGFFDDRLTEMFGDF